MTSPNLNPDKLRENIIALAKDGKSGHLGCALSLVEIVSSLYNKVINYNPNDPNDPERDYVVLSKGHGVMALYAVFMELGWIEESQVVNYLQDNTSLFGLAEDLVPGIEVSGGSLGHGLPVAVGMAYGLKRRNSSKKVFCIVGDGEINEGSMWEAFLFAGHHKLDNLIVIVDENQYQAMGTTKSILDLEPLDKKLEAFKFSPIHCNGHSLTELEEALLSSSELPKAIIAHTIKGSGVDFMEGENIWHYKKMNQEEESNALSQIMKKRHQS